MGIASCFMGMGIKISLQLPQTSMLCHCEHRVANLTSFKLLWPTVRVFTIGSL